MSGKKRNRLLRYGSRYASHFGRRAIRQGEKELHRSDDPTLDALWEAKRIRKGILRYSARIKKGFRKAAFLIGIFAFFLIVVFLLLTVFTSFVLASGNAAGEMIYGVITDGEIKRHIEELNAKGMEKYADAFSIALSAPEHDAEQIDSKGLFPDEARQGVKLYHYGSPRTRNAADADIYHSEVAGSQTSNGYHIYYLDSYGNAIGQQTSNTKDILCLSSVMVQNDYDQRVSEKAEEIFLFWFERLNPEPIYTVSELYDKEGSDRFPHGEKVCEGKTYDCNDTGFYNAYEGAVSDGVKFYDMPVEKTEYGCVFDQAAYDAAMTAYEEATEDNEEGALTAEPRREDFYSCPGHEALSCSYGYRAVNIYVTILTKDDVYAAAESGELRYRVPMDYACTSWEERTVDLTVPEGFREITGIFDREGGFTNPKMIDWCDHLYEQDWYDLYGINPYGDGVSLSTGAGSLSEEQIKEMVASIGGVSATRQEIISFALDQVGRIPYYWGGKARNAGFAGNGFGTLVKPDYKGRNKKGLDCSGFVSWVYWSVVSSESASCPVGQSTATFPGSLGLTRISAGELKPGDIGLEAPPGAGSNHIGFFVGYDESGRAKWVHCTGSSGATCNMTNCFRVYYRLFDD